MCGSDKNAPDRLMMCILRRNIYRYYLIELRKLSGTHKDVWFFLLNHPILMGRNTF